MLVAEAELLDRAAFDEGHRLDRLVGRARQDARVDVAPRRDDRAVRLHDRRDALVPALDERTARDFDDDRTLAHHFPFQLDDRDIVLLRLARTASTASIRPAHRLARTGGDAGRRRGSARRRCRAAAGRPAPAGRLPSSIRVSGWPITASRSVWRPGCVAASSAVSRPRATMRVDLRRHRMVGVQPLELAGRRPGKRRIADADPAHLVAADLHRHEGRAHAVERRARPTAPLPTAGWRHQCRRPGRRRSRSPRRRPRPRAADAVAPPAWPPMPSASTASTRPSASALQRPAVFLVRAGTLMLRALAPPPLPRHRS